MSLREMVQRLGWVPLSGDGDDIEKQKAEFKSLSKQFDVVICISTFTATLVVTFMSLARDIIFKNGIQDPDPDSQTLFKHGLLIAFLAMSTHLLTVIVAGRASILCFRIEAVSAAPPDIDISKFRNYFYLCEQLHFFASFMFLVTLLFLSFLIFVPKFSGIILCIYTFVGLALFYVTGFWRVSILKEDLRIFGMLFVTESTRRRIVRATKKIWKRLSLLRSHDEGPSIPTSISPPASPNVTMPHTPQTPPRTTLHAPPEPVAASTPATSSPPSPTSPSPVSRQPSKIDLHEQGHEDDQQGRSPAATSALEPPPQAKRRSGGSVASL